LIRTSSIDKGEGETLASAKDHPHGGFNPKGVVSTREGSTRLSRIHLETLIPML
jgi:hypothetical protein